LGPYKAAQLEIGDRLRVEAEGKGRVVITRIEEYMERDAGQLALPSDDNQPSADAGE
jgi:hypothetical protein